MARRALRVGPGKGSALVANRSPRGQTYAGYLKVCQPHNQCTISEDLLKAVDVRSRPRQPIDSLAKGVADLHAPSK